MKNVMIDNWGLESLAFAGEKVHNCPEFHKMLAAIILWDNVYYPCNEKSYFWKIISQEQGVEKYLKPCADYDDESFSRLAVQIYNNQYKEMYTKNLAVGAIKYNMVAESKGCDYLPCAKRSEFFLKTDYLSSDNLYNTITCKGIDKNDLFSVIDKTTQDKLKEFNEKVGAHLIRLNVPVLSNYVIETKPQNKTYYEYAYDLKKKGYIREFIKFVDKVESEWDKGNFRPYMQLCNDIEEIVNNISKDNMRFAAETNFIKIVPKIEFNIFDIRKYRLIFIKKIIKCVFDNNRSNIQCV